MFWFLNFYISSIKFIVNYYFKSIWIIQNKLCIDQAQRSQRLNKINKPRLDWISLWNSKNRKFRSWKTTPANGTGSVPSPISKTKKVSPKSMSRTVNGSRTSIFTMETTKKPFRCMTIWCVKKISTKTIIFTKPLAFTHYVSTTRLSVNVLKAMRLRSKPVYSSTLPTKRMMRKILWLFITNWVKAKKFFFYLGPALHGSYALFKRTFWGCHRSVSQNVDGK